MQIFTIGRTARLLGAGPGTARRRADTGRIATHRDEAGRRLTDGRDLAAFSVVVGRTAHTEDARVKATSVHVDRT